MKIIVTDLTRFSNKEIVCLAGIEPTTGVCVRPMLERGGKYEYLSFDSVKAHNIIPGSVLEGDFLPIEKNLAPHVEDHSTTGMITMHGDASSEEFEQVLEDSSVETVIDGFGSLPDNRLYISSEPPQKSIITLKLTSPRKQFKMVADQFNVDKFKACLVDEDGCQFNWLPITDLGFSDHVKTIRDKDPKFSDLNNFLWSQDVLYIRLGLTRRYASPAGDARDGYWVQVNGIYSFPNYREDLRIYD